MSDSPQQTRGRHRAGPGRRSELVAAVPIAVGLGALVGLMAVFLPKMFGSSHPVAATSPVSSTPVGTSSVPTGTASALVGATPVGTSTATTLSSDPVGDACTYAALAIVDTSLHKTDVRSVAEANTAIANLSVTLLSQYQELLRTEDADTAVSDTIGIARKLCATAGNPILARAAVNRLISIAPASDTSLLKLIVAFAGEPVPQSLASGATTTGPLVPTLPSATPSGSSGGSGSGSASSPTASPTASPSGT